MSWLRESKGKRRSQRILIATVQIPFAAGGSEQHAASLKSALLDAGHEAEVVAVPFKPYPPERALDHMLACRLLDLTEVNETSIDLLIGLRFPAYLISHPRKVLWILHQHREAYDLYDHPDWGMIRYPNGPIIRDAIRRADCELIPEARAVFANSSNVARRLREYCGIESTPLFHPPPHATEFYHAPAESYLFFPSRLTEIKRQRLVLEALSRTRTGVQIVFCGPADNERYAESLQDVTRSLDLTRRVRWLGAIPQDQKRDLYARCRGVLYPPRDEDYGYVTLEAMLSSKPVITCSDSGGTLEFVVPGVNGWVVDPTPDALASAMDELWTNSSHAERLGENGRDAYNKAGISWNNVVRTLTECA